MWFGASQSWRMAFVLSTLLGVTHTQEIRLVDDSDPSISYAGQWSHVPDGQQVGGAVKLTRQENATASLFFNGIGISVFGTQGTPGGNTTTSLYSIDGNSPAQYTAPSNLNTIQYRVQFYASPLLSDGPHTLVITNVNQNSWFWLDFINVTQASARALLNHPIPPTSSIPTDSPDPTINVTSLTTTLASATPLSTLLTEITFLTTPSTMAATAPTATFNPPSSTLNSASKQNTVPTGPAVGIALSSAILVGLAIFFACRWRKRRLERKLARGMPEIEPFERPDDRQLPPPLLHGTVHSYVVEHFGGSTDIADSNSHLVEKASTIHRPRTVPPPDAQSSVPDLPTTYGYPIPDRHG